MKGYYAIVKLEDKKMNVIQFSEKTKVVESLQELKKEIQDSYGINFKNAKAMYVDTKSGKSKKVGWVIDTWQYYDDTKQRFPATFWITPVMIDEREVELK